MADNKIRISFDLDEVLFVNPSTHKTEPALHFPFNLYYKERLRYGTPELINTLKNMGIEVWVYTSSYRSEQYIKGLFYHYHVRFDSIVNAQRHLKEVQRDNLRPLPQKMPGYYRIDLHIDDENVIVSYGKNYGFDVLQIDAEDSDWKEKIISRVKYIKESR